MDLQRSRLYDFIMIGLLVGSIGLVFWYEALATDSPLRTILAWVDLALVIFFVSFLQIRARATALKTVILTTCAALFTLGLSHTLNLSLPEGLLQDMVQLPWPIGYS